MGCGGSTQSTTDAPKVNTRTKTKNISKGNKSSRELIDSLVPDGTVGNMLKDVPVFRNFTETQRDKVGGCMIEETTAPNTVIFAEGDESDKFYVILTGSVEVQVGGKKVAVLGEGEYFGEGGLMDAASSKRGGTIKSISETKCLTLEKGNFLTLFGDLFKVNFVNRRKKVMVVDERDQLKMGEEHEKVTDPQDIDFLLASVKDNILFGGSHLNEEQTRDIIGEMYEETVPKGHVLIKQGDIGVHFYVVKSGSFKITKDTEEETNKFLINIKRGECVGELALFNDDRRAATVTATEPSVVWKVDRFHYRMKKMKITEEKRSKFIRFLNQIPLFAPLSQFEKRKVAESLEVVMKKKAKFKDGEVPYIYQEGESKNLAMYIVNKGSVIIRKTGEEDKIVKEGEYFGASDLLHKATARQESAIIDSDKVVVARLDRATFEIILGPLEELMMKKEKGEEIQHVNTEWESISTPKEDLIPIFALGQGSYGYVQLVKDKNTGETYALKALSKAQLDESGTTKHVMHEKETMVRLQHPFILRLYATYKDRDCLYFLMESALGGELYKHLTQGKPAQKFSVWESKFYGGSVILAFQYMHSKNIVYRDLKPENVLIHKDGYIKLADFGFAKEIPKGYSETMCGTPEYLSPEMVLRESHGKATDWWTVGVSIYEYLYGTTPFCSEKQMQLYQNIIHGQYRFPSEFSAEARYLIQALLNPNQSLRLGATVDGAEAIKQHAWFNDFDFVKLGNKEYDAPYIPDISNAANTDIEAPHFPPYTTDCTWDADF